MWLFRTTQYWTSSIIGIDAMSLFALMPPPDRHIAANTGKTMDRECRLAFKCATFVLCLGIFGVVAKTYV